MANVDIVLFQYINNFAGRYLWLDAVGIFFAKYAEYVLVGSLATFLVINTKKYWPMVWQGSVSAIFSRFVITEIIRWLWLRPRPFIENEVNLLIEKVNEASFPSGHAAFYFALSTVVFFYNKKTGLLFFLASLLITIYRVFVGVHWPSDILAGALIGMFSGVGVFFLSRRFSAYSKR